jgi:hypothetical protein
MIYQQAIDGSSHIPIPLPESTMASRSWVGSDAITILFSTLKCRVLKPRCRFLKHCTFFQRVSLSDCESPTNRRWKTMAIVGTRCISVHLVHGYAIRRESYISRSSNRYMGGACLSFGTWGVCWVSLVGTEIEDESIMRICMADVGNVRCSRNNRFNFSGFSEFGTIYAGIRVRWRATKLEMDESNGDIKTHTPPFCLAFLQPNKSAGISPETSRSTWPPPILQFRDKRAEMKMTAFRRIRLECRRHHG